MRIVNPYPWGHAPRNRDVADVVAQSSGGALLRANGERISLVSKADLLALGPVVEGVAPFDEAFTAQVFLAIEGAAGRIATLRIAADGGVHYQGASPQDMWSGFAPAADPRVLFEWLARAGLRGPLDRYEMSLGDAGPADVASYRSAAPPSIVEIVDAALTADVVPPSLAPEANARLLAASGSRPAAIASLLAWYGSGAGPLAMRGDHEHFARLLLAAYGFDEVVATFASLASDAARAGAGRFVVDAAPLPPVLAQSLAAVPADVRSAIDAAFAAVTSPADADALHAWLFPAPIGAPAGTSLVGVSSTVRLRRPVAHDATLFALDGNDVARFEGGERRAIAMLLREAPLAVHDGALLWRTGAVIQRRALDGSPLPTAPAPTPEQAEAARAQIATWSVTPPPGLLAIAPTPHENEAFETFAHLGYRPPPSARVAGRAFVDVAGCALVRVDTISGSPSNQERIPLPGTPLAWAVSASSILVLVKTPDSAMLVIVPDVGPPRFCSIALDPAPIAFFLATESSAFLGIDTGAGILIARAAS